MSCASLGTFSRACSRRKRAIGVSHRQRGMEENRGTRWWSLTGGRYKAAGSEQEARDLPYVGTHAGSTAAGWP
jgi:hypothetical protein